VEDAARRKRPEITVAYELRDPTLFGKFHYLHAA
jgi:hypothetical protein